MAALTVARSEHHDQFAATLRFIRHRAGFSQKQIAERAEMDTRSIADYERGVKAPASRDRLEMLYDAIEATTSEREALDTIWSLIGANTTINKALPKKAGPKEVPFPPALEEELRALQDVITGLRKSRHDKAPFLVCDILNCVEKITQQAKEASYGI